MGVRYSFAKELRDEIIIILNEEINHRYGTRELKRSRKEGRKRNTVPEREDQGEEGVDDIQSDSWSFVPVFLHVCRSSYVEMNFCQHDPFQEQQLYRVPLPGRPCSDECNAFTHSLVQFFIQAAQFSPPIELLFVVIVRNESDTMIIHQWDTTRVSFV